jgi:predicted anti-sigma-YlaC factor YlaD
MNSTPHLSEREIDSVLIGAPAAGITAHLSQCGHCRQRVAEARVPITRFKAVTLSWSERQSATLPLRSSTAGSMTWKRRAALAATATAALLIGLAIPLTKSELQFAPESAGHRAGSSTAEVAAVSAPALSATMKRNSATAQAATTDVADNEQDEQIARDNQMLQNINQALDNPVESPADAYSLQPADGHQQAAPLTELN